MAARVQRPTDGGTSVDGLLLVYRSQLGAFQRVTDSASAAYEPRALALSGWRAGI
jgi:hypothetical protein